KKLSEIDQDLAEVRIKIQGAQAEADRLGFARTRIDELAKGKPPKGARAQDYQQFIDDFRDFAANLDQVPENVATSVVALLDAADSTARRLAGEELSYDLISQRSRKN